MDDAKKAWAEVGEKLSALGLKLKLHTEEETAKPDDDASGFDRLKQSIDEVLNAVGDAARDPAVREDAKSVAGAFASAIDATVDEARKSFRSKQSP